MHTNIVYLMNGIRNMAVMIIVDVIGCVHIG